MLSIKELRQIMGLSQSQFANKYQLNVQTLQHWEQGFRNVPSYYLYLLNRIITEVDYAKRATDKDIS